VTDESFKRLAQRLYPGGELLRAWPLSGGVSARVSALELRSAAGQVERLVVRQYGAATLASNPDSASDEFRLLHLLRSAGVAVPTPVFFDQTGQVFSSPALVTGHVDGQTDLNTAGSSDGLGQMAEYLSGLHGIRLTDLDVSFLRPLPGLPARPASLDHSLSEERIRDVLEPVWPMAPINPPVILHGDFWPGNLLWQAGQLAAVIDWEDAALGDPLADLGNARLELLWAFGQGAMDGFTRHDRARSGIDLAHLPYWDLYAALKPAGRLATWGLETSVEQAMRERHRMFVEQALSQLTQP
jgi:aminoglycoside phosphotransferase (APT) family kinase protein